MKKGKHYRKEPKKVRFNKALLLGAVSLLLVAMMAVTSTVSWIEDVSQVEFSSTDGHGNTHHPTGWFPPREPDNRDADVPG